MKLTKLAIAVTIATSVALAGCSGKKSSKKEVKKADNQEQAKLTALSIEVNGAAIEGASEETVTFKNDGKIVVTPAKAQATALKQSKRSSDAYQVLVIENAINEEGIAVIESEKQPRKATLQDLTAEVIVKDGVVTVEFTLYNPSIARIILVRTGTALTHEITEFNKAGFNLTPESDSVKLAAAKTGVELVAVDGAPTGPLSDRKVVKANMEIAGKIILSTEAVRDERTGSVLVEADDQAIIAYNETTLRTPIFTSNWDNFKALTFKELNAAGAEVFAIVKTTPTEGKPTAKLVEVTGTDESKTVAQAEVIADADAATQSIIGYQILVDSGLNARAENEFVITEYLGYIPADENFGTSARPADLEYNLIDVLLNREALKKELAKKQEEKTKAEADSKEAKAHLEAATKKVEEAETKVETLTLAQGSLERNLIAARNERGNLPSDATPAQIEAANQKITGIEEQQRLAAENTDKALDEQRAAETAKNQLVSPDPRILAGLNADVTRLKAVLDLIPEPAKPAAKVEAAKEGKK
jgi:hypothetical protein